MGPGSDDPRPTACIACGKEIVGWVDYETGHEWLAPGEVNVGYNVFAGHRRRGHATRALMLLVHRLAVEGQYRTASVVIDRRNTASLAVAIRAGFTGRRKMGDSDYLARPVPPVTYSDGVVAIRRQDPADLEAHLTATDEEQIRWLWLPGERERWEAMMPAEQAEHAERVLRANRDGFGSGPKWIFSIDTPASPYVAYIDCDLASPNALAGEANIAYACHPDHRGRGYVSRALRLVLRFLAEHTGARCAHLVIERDNEPSLRVARSVATVAPTAFVDDRGRAALRFVLEIGSARSRDSDRSRYLPVATSRA
jgi:RimJ/RimL family protein N-acetyltransferase